MEEGNAYANADLALPVQGDGLGQLEEQVKRINWFVILEVFFESAASCIGTVGFLWATVVLLGGFVSQLNPVDFWFITVLSFLHAIRIIGSDWNPDQKVIYGLLLNSFSESNSMKQMESKICSLLVKALAIFCRPSYSSLLAFGRSFCELAAFLLHMVRCVVPIVWAALSFPHLLLQNCGNIGRSAEDINLRAALNLFYGLAVSQALLSFIAITYSSSRIQLLVEISQRYKFKDSGDKPMELYYFHVRRVCRDEGFSKAINMSLVTFAVGSLSSEDRDVHLSGTKILHNLVVAGSAYIAQALARVRDSPDAINSLFRMIASASLDGKLRERATIIMAKLSDNLSVSGFPCAAMRAICSLLDTREDEAKWKEAVPTSDGDVRTNDIDKNLILKGMDILEQLSCKSCNLSEISNSHELMSRLIGFTSHDHVSAAASINFSGDKDVNFRKVMCSLMVFGRFAMDTGKQGITLRQEMLQNVFLLSNIRQILQHPSISHWLRMQAITTVSAFALDAAARDHDGTTKMLRVLLSILCNPHGAANNEAVQLAAGKAIAGLTTESRVNCGAILRAGYLQTTFRDMLCSQHGGARRVAVANVLKNLCEYSEPGSPDQNTMRDFAGANISTVLTRIDQTANLVGEDMEAFLGLALQFSKLIPVGQFNVALAEVGCEKFVHKLKSILEANNLSDDICPGIRRFTIEQAIWMMQSESELHCIQYFVSCSMLEALVRVQETATRQENYKLLSRNMPVLEYEESPSSLVKRALELIQ